MKKNIRYIGVVVLIVAAMLLGTGCDLLIKTNDAKVDLNWYMGLTYEDENGADKSYTTEAGEIAAVVLENAYSEDYALIKDGDVYVNIDTVKEAIDDRFYWDRNEKILLFTNAKQIYTTPIGGSEITGEKKETTAYVISFTDQDKCYVNMKFVTKFIDMKYEIQKKTEEAPARICLKYSNDKKTILSTTKKIALRTKGNYQNMVVTNLDKGTQVILLESGKNWDKVRTEDGWIGYLPVKRLNQEGSQQAKFKSDKEEYTHVTLNQRVSLAWNQIYNQSANANLEELIANVKGVNVISPTWFSLFDKRGNLSTLAELDYVETAHKKGMQVWALVNDFKSKKLTKQVLESTTSRQRLVSNIMFYIDNFDLDGVNIDFEYINVQEADSYLQFLRELSIECRKAKKVLSIDNYVPSEWTEFYDREQQALLADYLIIMNYDEHTTSSTEAGSVSSLSYAEKGIQDTIAQTGDPSRVVNGMPFYTRIWTETPEAEGSSDAGKLIQDAVNGNYYLSSQAVGMNAATKAYTEAGVKPELDETTGQNYVTYSKGKSLYRIWLEDAMSVQARLELMNQYKLGGAAYWSLGQENDNIWKTIAPYFK